MAQSKNKSSSCLVSFYFKGEQMQYIGATMAYWLGTSICDCDKHHSPRSSSTAEVLLRYTSNLSVLPGCSSSRLHFWGKYVFALAHCVCMCVNSQKGKKCPSEVKRVYNDNIYIITFNSNTFNVILNYSCYYCSCNSLADVSP